MTNRAAELVLETVYGQATKQLLVLAILALERVGKASTARLLAVIHAERG